MLVHGGWDHATRAARSTRDIGKAIAAGLITTIAGIGTVGTGITDAPVIAIATAMIAAASQMRRSDPLAARMSLKHPKREA
jgi:hypothetical protein